jgi:hypothetical protein
MRFSNLVQLAGAIAIASAMTAPVAQAQMNENYAGISAGASFNDSNTDFALGIDGRYKIPRSDFSARASIRPLNNLSAQATATYDFSLGRGVGTMPQCRMRPSESPRFEHCPAGFYRQPQERGPYIAYPSGSLRRIAIELHGSAAIEKHSSNPL